MISPQTIQNIRNRIDIIEIVGGFVKLRKRGTNYLGLCPFHNEKSPSFTVSPAKEIYKCFGCGKTGNAISFLMEHEKFSYVEALRWLANKYHIDVEETELTPEIKLQNQTAESLHIINAFAQKFFTEQLFNTVEGADIGHSYLKHRGFGDDVLKKFQVGYSPEKKNAFAKAAVQHQFNEELLLKTGLVVKRNEELQDNYRGRIIFPVHNQTGKIIGFGARIIKSNDKSPKYINTPENEVYVKSKILYGTYFARQAIDKSDECLLVEGYTDVVSLHQSGIENVVASGGTSLTQDQIRLIKKYTSNLTIIYDGDQAGVKAALRGLDMAIEEGLNVKLVLIPDKEDPDSYANKLGAVAFRDFVAKNKKDFILFQLEVALHDAGTDSNRKATVVNQIAETISKINKAEDFTKQQDYIRQCSDMLKIDEAGLNTLVNKFIRERITKIENKLPVDEARYYEDVSNSEEYRDYSDETFNLLHQDLLQEQAIVRVLLEYGQEPWDENSTVAEYIFEEHIDDDLFEDQALLHLFNSYKNAYHSGLKPTARDFINSEDQEISKTTIAVTNFPYEHSKKWVEHLSSGGVNKKIWDLGYKDFLNKVLVNGEINHAIYDAHEESDYKHIVEDVLIFLKLRKLKKLISLNQKDLEQQHPEHEVMTLLQTHMHLKQIQRELGQKKGLVVYPF